MTAPSVDKIAARSQLRRALELICRKTNPHEVPFIFRPARLTDYGAAADLDLRGVPLQNSYLRGIDFDGARLAGADQLNGADLRDARLSNAAFVTPPVLARALLWDAQHALTLPAEAQGQKPPQAMPALPTPLGPVFALAALPDGRLASAGGDGIRIWDLEVRRCIAWYASLDDQVSFCADSKGVHFSRTADTWMTVEHAQQVLPADALLAKHAHFVAGHSVVLAAYELPQQIEWDDVKKPTRLTLKWPAGFDWQAALGQAQAAADAGNAA